MVGNWHCQIYAGSNPVVPIVAFGQHKTLMGCFKTTLEVWQSGLLQNPAKIPCLVIGTTGSNPVTSVGEYFTNCGSIVANVRTPIHFGDVS